MRKITVFTGSRAEYGLLSNIIYGLKDHPEVELSLVIGGMHLSKEFGYTISEIEEDGVPISAKLEFLLSSDTPVGISKSVGLAIISAAEYFDRNTPEILVILGDRFETMAVAQAAMLARIPIAHIHGGETTEGCIDEAIRHSVTKMAHLHFTTTEVYAERIRQMGENPKYIYNYGAPGIDNINKLNLLNKRELSKSIDFEINGKFIMVTYHPVTLLPDSGYSGLTNLLAVLDKYTQYQLIFSYPNADSNNSDLRKLIEEYQEKNKARVYLSRSLGKLKYLSALKNCEMVVGNSSSALIEAPSFGIPTVNIGDRQKGRVYGETVLNCNDNETEIESSINYALSDGFKQKCKHAKNPYGKGQASKNIIEKLINLPLENLIFKKFFDV